MNYKKMKNDDFIFLSNVRINNTMNDETMQSPVAKYGYTPEKMAVGKLLLDEAEKLSSAFH